MKAYIDTDEWYPVYVLAVGEGELYTWSNEVDVPEELIAEYKETLEKFTAVQQKLSAIFNS